MAGSQLEIIAGLLHLNTDFVEKRIHDKSRVYTMLSRFKNPFPHLLLENTLRKRKCTDPIVDVFENDETRFEIRCLPVTGDPYHIDVLNADAPMVKPMMVLMNTFIDYQLVGTTATYTKAANLADAKASVFSPENAMVAANKGTSPDNVGYTRFQITREHQLDVAAGSTVSDSSSITTATWDSTTAGDAIGCIRIVYKTNKDGGLTGEATAKNLGMVTNYITKIERDIAISDWMMLTDQFGEDNPWVRIKQDGVKDIGRENESALLFSKGKSFSIDGKSVQLTVGLNQLVRNNTHVVAGNKIKDLNNALAPIIDVGESRERWWVAGSGAMLKITDIVEDKLVYDSDTVSKIGITVKTFQDYLGGIHHIVESSEMSRDKVYRNRAFVINFDYLEYGYLAGQDIHLWMGPNGTGTQGNNSPNLEATYKGAIGLISRFRGDQTKDSSGNYTNPGAQGCLVF